MRQGTDLAMNDFVLSDEVEQKPYEDQELQTKIENIVKEIVPENFEYNEEKVGSHVARINEQIDKLLGKNYIYSSLVFIADTKAMSLSKTSKVPDPKNDLQKIVEVKHSKTVSTFVVLQCIWFASVGWKLE